MTKHLGRTVTVGTQAAVITRIVPTNWQTATEIKKQILREAIDKDLNVDDALAQVTKFKDGYQYSLVMVARPAPVKTATSTDSTDGDHYDQSKTDLELERKRAKKAAYMRKYWKARRKGTGTTMNVSTTSSAV